MMQRLLQSAPKFGFVFALLILSFGYGYWSHRSKAFPHSWIRQASEGLRQVRREAGVERPWFYADSAKTERVVAHRPTAMQAGLTLLAGVGPDNRQFARVVDAEGKVINEWSTDWFDHWPDASHLAEDIRPKSRPGAIVHGMLLLDDGGLVFQHDGCGMVRVDAAGNVVWRLPRRTHHSMHLDERGHIWTSVWIHHYKPLPGLPGYRPRFDEFTIVEISPGGEVLQEVSVFDLLRENDLHGLLYVTSSDKDIAWNDGDTLHVNDVEVFPATMRPGFFKPGDVMVSLREPGAVAVFDLPNRKLKHLSIGAFVRQHDPDFVDGNTISIFDNNNVGRPAEGVYSRILRQTVPNGKTEVVFAGAAECPFYSNVMGKHQWLANGNLMLVEAVNGRVLEVDPEGRVVWEYNNLVGGGVVGAMSEGTRLPSRFTPEFFAERRARVEAAKVAAAFP